MAAIERYLVQVGWAHRVAGLADPTADPLVKFESKAARNAVGVRQTQARSIRLKGDIADLDCPAAGVCRTILLKACRRDALGLRDGALLRVAYDTGARRSELLAIEAAHIDGPDADSAGALLLPSSRTYTTAGDTTSPSTALAAVTLSGDSGSHTRRLVV